jgi:hypothetical protein
MGPAMLLVLDIGKGGRASRQRRTWHGRGVPPCGPSSTAWTTYVIGH